MEKSTISKEGDDMPHIVVKMFPGRSDDQKKELAEAITKNVMEICGSKERSISVGIEEVEPEVWDETVYKDEIKTKWDTLYKEPGYDPFA